MWLAEAYLLPVMAVAGVAYSMVINVKSRKNPLF